MSQVFFYLDESGDLGWAFNRHYRTGGSSRHLTVAALKFSHDSRHRPTRVIRRLYQKYGWDTARERKWADMGSAARLDFAQQAKELATKFNDIKYFSITVKKENVQAHIRGDPNKLYNYMTRLSLLKEMAKYEAVTLVPDPRSIKVKSGNSLQDYLQIALWFELEVITQIETLVYNSSSSKKIQFADMLSGLVQSHFEDGKSEPWEILSPYIASKKLFF